MEGGHMEIKGVRLIWKNSYGYRFGKESGIITGVKITEYLGQKRICFEVTYPSDNFIDYVNMIDFANGECKIE